MFGAAKGATASNIRGRALISAIAKGRDAVKVTSPATSSGGHEPEVGHLRKLFDESRALPLGLRTSVALVTNDHYSS